MLEYDRIDFSEEIDINKKWIKRVCYLLRLVFNVIGFKYEPYLFHGCQDLMQKAVSFNDVVCFC